MLGKVEKKKDSPKLINTQISPGHNLENDLIFQFLKLKRMLRRPAVFDLSSIENKLWIDLLFSNHQSSSFKTVIKLNRSRLVLS